jgi:hypothetical protein
MRCPQCSERNSVAANKCEYCGEKFKRKPLPLSVKLTIGAFTLAIGGSIVASLVVPKLIDPEQGLIRSAKRMAAGPSSLEDAKKIKKEFNDAMRTYLLRAGSLKPAELAQSLQKILPNTAFEVHVAELPRGLKVVEVDALLQASDYVVMKTDNSVKVFFLPELEVFDDARILNDSAGPVLAMLGHSGGQPPHKPQVRTYALLPDFLQDETDKLVPPIAGDGTANFDKNGHDVHLDVSLNSAAKGQNISLPGDRDEILHETLQWKDARYAQRFETPGSAGAALTIVAQALRHPEMTDASARLPGSAVLQIAKSNPAKTGDAIKIVVNHGKKVTTYAIASGTANYEIDLQGGPGSWNVPKARLNKTVAIATAPPASATTPPADTSPPLDGAQAAALPPAAPPVAPPVTATHGSTKPSTSTSHTRVAPIIGGQHTADNQQSSGSSKHKKHGHDRSQDSQQTASNTTTASRPESTSTRAHISSKLGSVNLRSGPSTQTGSLTKISKGARIDIIGKSEGWYKVRYHGQEGYVLGSLVDAPNTPPEAATPPVTTSSSGHRDRHRRHLAAAPTTAPITPPADTPAPTATSTHSRHGKKTGKSHAAPAPAAEDDAPQFVP